jgi:hypothetical protein
VPELSALATASVRSWPAEGSAVGIVASEAPRAGDLQAGLQHARQVTADTAPDKVSQPMFYNGSMFTTAECLLSQAEAKRPNRNAPVFNEIGALLAKVDVRTMSETSDLDAYTGSMDVALARLDLLREDYGSAAKHAAAAAPFFKGNDVDPYQKRELEIVSKTLAARGQ